MNIGEKGRIEILQIKQVFLVFKARPEILINGYKFNITTRVLIFLRFFSCFHKESVLVSVV